jgi:ketosteroid isomerase-like protein
MVKQHAWRWIGTAIVLGSILSCAPQQPAATADTRADDEAAIRKADMDWANTAQSKQVDAWMTYYTDDVAVLPPNESMAIGTEQARKSIGGLLALPGLNLKWTPSKTGVARSGDLGYSYGAYEMTFNDPKGNPVSDKGKYVEVWKKQPDGKWKCAVDTFNSDLPAAPPPAK